MTTVGQFLYRHMTASDYDAVLQLWQNTEHLSLNECDTREGIELYLKRNVGLCFVAERDGALIGTVLCGHDGRRGILRHLAVRKDCRGCGIARELSSRALQGLAEEGISRCNIFVDNQNSSGLKFWSHLGWWKLSDTFQMLQNNTEETSNA